MATITTRAGKGAPLTNAEVDANFTSLNTELSGKLNANDVSVTNAREWTATTVDQVEAEAGTATTRRAWTAQRVFQAVAAWWNASAFKTKLDGIEAGAQVNTVLSVAGKTGGVTLGPADVGAAAASHGHAIADVSGLQTALDGKQAALGFTPVQQGGGAGQGASKVYIGWAVGGLAVQVDSTSFGTSWPISITSNAATATTLQTARTISLTGDVTGSASFDGSANASITATVADDSHNHIISNVDGLQAALDLKLSKDNVVGTVSQSGGIPTGAVVERGSNANGEYVRYADGTLICTHTLNVGPWAAHSSANASWTYPSAFSSSAKVSANGNTASPHVFNASSFGSAAGATVFYGGSEAATGTVELIAVGRWY